MLLMLPHPGIHHGDARNPLSLYTDKDIDGTFLALNLAFPE